MDEQSADRTEPPIIVSSQFGVPIESALERRERFADKFDYDFGHERVFVELVQALLDELPADSDLLEVGAATGLLTKPLLSKARKLTALEPSAGMLRRLLAKDIAEDPRLSTIQGIAEDLPDDSLFDVAVVTFTPRRGVGLLRLLSELAAHVSDRVVMMLDDDGSLDWAYLARAAAAQGFDARIHIVTKACGTPEERRGVLLSFDVSTWCPDMEPLDVWELAAREVDVPYPAPRGSATRLMRYFLSGGDRALLIRTDQRGMDRLYGSLRTAAHRLARDHVTVRRTGDAIQLVRLPKSEE